eukprot:50032-Ditylum_brightwellii.AAC.1
MSYHLCQIQYSAKNNPIKQQELKVRCTVGKDTELVSSMSVIQQNATKEVAIVMLNSESEPKWPRKNLKREWDKAMKKPISTSEARFGSPKLNT